MQRDVERDIEREMYPGRGFGLSEKKEKAIYFPLTQAGLGPIPILSQIQENFQGGERKRCEEVSTKAENENETRRQDDVRGRG